MIGQEAIGNIDSPGARHLLMFDDKVRGLECLLLRAKH